MTAVYALIIGYILDLIIGDPRSIPHPIIFIGNLIAKTEKLMRKVFPKNSDGETMGGAFTWLIVACISFLIPFFILFYSYRLNLYLGIALESVMCFQILATHSLKKESMKVYYSLKKGDIKEARLNVSMIVGRDTKDLDEKGITKAAVETVAENTSDGVIAPLIFIAIGGAPLGFLYKAINTMDSMLGYTNDKYINFGKTAAIIDDIANYLPSRISAFIMIFATIFTGQNTKNAFKIWLRDKRKHKSPNSAQTEAVCAGALEIQLAGDAVYKGIVHKKDFIGDDIKPVEPEDIKKANKLMYATSIISVILFLAIKVGVIFALGGTA